MKRVAIILLLTLLSVACAASSQAQNKHGVPYGHQSQKQAQKAAEKQRKQYEKAARKQLKKAEKYQKKQQKAVDREAHNPTKVDHHSVSGSH